MLGSYFLIYFWVTLLVPALAVFLVLVFSSSQVVKASVITVSVLVMASSLVLAWQAPAIVNHYLEPKLESVTTLTPPELKPADYPWRSVGRVLHKTGDNLYTCSGTLIAPDSVLTAAHCLVQKDETLAPAENLLFTLPGQASPVPVTSYKTGENFRPVSHKTPENSRDDWAVLKLSEKSGTRAVPPASALKDPPKGRTIYAAGYPSEKNAGLYVMKNCRIIRGFPLRFFIGFSHRRKIYDVHICPMPRGASGGPLLSRKSDGSFELRAVHVARTAQMGVRLGVSVSPDIDEENLSAGL